MFVQADNENLNSWLNNISSCNKCFNGVMGKCEHSVEVERDLSVQSGIDVK